MFGLPAAARSSQARSSQAQALSGSLLGLTTLDEQGAEQTTLFELDLKNGDQRFLPLPNYRFGHNLEALADKHWLAVPYGDDDQACLILDQKGHVIREIEAPAGAGFGGHGAVLPDGKHVFLHFNKSQREVNGGGEAVIVNSTNGQVLKRTATPVMHGHDTILSRNGHIILADDGVLDLDDPEPLLTKPIKPALYYFTPELTLSKTTRLPINGCFVHIAENQQGMVTGAVEQYVRRTEAGHNLLKSLIGSDAEAYIKQFAEDAYPDDVPLPGPILTVTRDGTINDRTFSLDHQDPFDMVFNEVSGKTCCVFTESNLIASRGAFGWHYLKGAEVGLTSPYGLVNIGQTSLIAVNDFDQGVLIIDTRDMSVIGFFDVPTRGVKHLSYAAS